MNQVQADAEGPLNDDLPFSADALVLPIPLHRFHRHQGDTNNCGPFCVAIVVNGLRGETVLDGSTVARRMERLRWSRGLLPIPVLDKIPGWTTLPWGLSDELRRHGFRARWRLFGTRERLLRNLLTGRVTIVAVGEPFRFVKGRWRGWGHLKLLYAWDPERGWAFVDPGIVPQPGRAWLAHGIGWQDDKTFVRQWGWMLRFMVEVG